MIGQFVTIIRDRPDRRVIHFGDKISPNHKQRGFNVKFTKKAADRFQASS